MFLNKPKFIESLFKIFEEAEKELVLVVPYIKMSTDVFNALKDCDTRDVETLIVCRKDCLHPKELQKLRQLKNLTLLAHPNLHSKIYLNQNDIIIGSMNLYEYSQKFNREAGVLLSNINPKGNTSNILGFSDGDPSEDCRVEIQNIISSSEEIFVSKKAAEYGVDFTILKTLDELQYDKAKTLSKYFTTKKFQLLETKEGLHPTCKDFFDSIDVAISHRIVVTPNYPEHIAREIVDEIVQNSWQNYEPFRIYPYERPHRLTIYGEEGYETIDVSLASSKKYAKEVEHMLRKLCAEIDSNYKERVR